MSVHAKRDKNNFISIILNKIMLASNYSQKCNLSITSKLICNHIKFKFYLRRRYKQVYLYVRFTDNFGNIQQRHEFYRDLQILIPNIEIESIKGHYTGLTINTSDQDSLHLFLKLISLLSSPKDFNIKKTKIYKVYHNRFDVSNIPIHIHFTHKQLCQLKCHDLIRILIDET